MPEIIHLSETVSTNTYLKNLLTERDLDEESIVVTDFQTAGKGQRGNSWESEKGKNLLFSIVLYPDIIKANEQFIISQFVSLAIKDLLSEYTEDISIKWPNDIYWKDKKICGILIENSLIEDKISQSIIGIGININQEVFLSNAPNPISLTLITKDKYILPDLLKKISKSISHYYTLVKENKKTLIIEKYSNSLFRKDGYHWYNDGEKDFLAKFDSIMPSGILVLETEEGEKRHFAFKEVSFKL